MAPVSSCPACGTPLQPASSTAGLCAACLLKQVLLEDENVDLDGFGHLEAGSTFGRFQILGLLGRGGMATVYEAREGPPLERTVALKVLTPELLHHESFAARSTHEAKVVAGLEHPHIVPIYASGIEDRLPWMSMRLMRDGSLDTLLGQGLGIQRTIQILRGVAEALDYAHANGVLHRDVKPTNILLDATGAGCLSDFGLARLLEGSEALTVTGTVAGTPHYMAPEQALGNPLDSGCDIYSLGVVAYEMLTGRIPFQGDSPVAIGVKHVNARPPAPAPHLVSGAAFKVLRKALAKKSVDRWRSAGAFVSALEAAGARAPLPAGRALAGVSAVAIAAAAVAGLWAVIPRTSSMLLGSKPLVVAWDTLPESRTPPPVWSPGTADDPVPVPSATPLEPVAVVEGPKLGDDVEPSPPPVETDPPKPLLDEPSDPKPSPSNDAETQPKPRPVVPPPSNEVTVILPKVIKQVEPVYPAIARSRQIQGAVILQGLVGADGTVTQIKVIDSAHGVLNDAAVKAFSQFRYAPGTRNGVATPSLVQVTVKFEFK